MRHIVIGAGPAGVAACETLRGLDPKADIILLAGEPEPPYSRMAIPYLLVQRIGESGTHLRQSADHFRSLGIDVRHGRAARVDTGANRLHLHDGSELDYDRLLIASGASPLAPPVPGIELPGVLPCWTLENARAIAHRLEADAPVVLMGAGFIACIILEALMTRGARLTIVEREERMLPRMMNPVASAMLKRWVEDKGARVLTGHTVNMIEQADEGLSVCLDSGESLDARLVISAVGVASNTDFLQGSGVRVDQGVVVDRYLRSNVENIFAAGDVAQGRDFSTQDFQVQAIQPTAVEHGRIAATNMARGRALRHDGSLNMNVLDTLGLISTSFGDWQGQADGEQAELLDESGWRYLNLQFSGEHLVGASSLGHTEHIGVVRGLIQGRVALGEWKQRLLRDPTRLMEAWLARSLACAAG